MTNGRSVHMGIMSQYAGIRSMNCRGVDKSGTPKDFWKIASWNNLYIELIDSQVPAESGNHQISETSNDFW